MTEEIPQVMDMLTVVSTAPEKLRDRDWLDRVGRRLSEHVSLMHKMGFVHNDLKWRNVLVDFEESPEVYLFDCPLGRKMIGPLLNRGIIKDLACLDKVAKYQLSRTERLRFYKYYVGKDRLDSFDRDRIKKILGFFLVDIEVAVAGDSKRLGRKNAATGKKLFCAELYHLT